MIRRYLSQTGHLLDGFLHIPALFGIAIGAFENEVVDHVRIALESQVMLAIKSWNH
jgi:hypothetical protein